MPAAPHILVFEPDAHGHQMEYLRHLLTKIDQDVPDARVTLLTTAEAASHPNCRRLDADFRHLVSVRIAPAVVEGNRLFRAIDVYCERQWRNAEMLARGLEQIGVDDVDFVLLPHLEAIGLLHLGLRRNLFRGKPWATISISVRFHHRQCGMDGPNGWSDLLQLWAFHRVIRYRRLACFGSINPYFAQAVPHPKVAHCPEPGTPPLLASREDACAAYGVRPDTLVVLVFGVIDRRKCVDVLLEGVARVVPGLDLTVLLAVPRHAGHLAPVLSSDAARKLREHGRLIEVDRFILSGQDIDPMGAADIVWLFYERNFVASSSVLVRSALSRRPVIARRQGVVGRLVEEHRLGLALGSDAPDSIAAALSQLAGDPALRREMGENGARAFAANTPDNFARPIVEAINRVASAAC